MAKKKAPKQVLETFIKDVNLLCGPEQDKVPRQSVKVFLSENNSIVFGASFEKD